MSHVTAAPPYPNPHSPGERRLLSNVGHWIEGTVLAGSSGLALLDAMRPDLGWPGRWSPRVSTAAGALLGSGILIGTLHHGGPSRYLRHEHQDREHLQMAAIITAGGLVESRRRLPLGGLGGAASMAAIGGMFLRHEQHGSAYALQKSLAAHRRLGLSLLAAGVAKAADTVRLPGPWRFGWPVLALGVAGQLLAYREPPGAYESH
jgi:hypothetical protein